MTILRPEHFLQATQLKYKNKVCVKITRQVTSGHVTYLTSRKLLTTLINQWLASAAHASARNGRYRCGQVHIGSNNEEFSGPPKKKRLNFMPEYRLLYRVEAPLRYQDDICLETQGHLVRFLFSQVHGNESSVMAQVELNALHYRAAQQLAAGTIIPPALDALTFATGVPTLLGECELTLKNERGSQKRHGIYVGKRAVAHPVQLRQDAVELAQAILRTGDEPKLPLCWFRYSQHRDLVIEQFVFAWRGFEELAGDAEIGVSCPECGHVVTHRGANKERAWELFHAANPEVEQRDFNRDIWGRARNSLFHGSQYPEPNFLSSLSSMVPQLRRSVARELRTVFNIDEHWEQPRKPEHLYRVFLFFEWQTENPNVDFAQDWPSEQLHQLAEHADPGATTIPRGSEILLTHTEFNRW